LARKLVFPNKAAMVRRANVLLVMLAVAPVLYLVIAFLVTFEKPGFAGNPVFISVFFIVLASVSVANIGFTVFTQTSKKLMSAGAGYDPVGRIFHLMSLGAVLSEVHAVYGLALTLLAGSIMYGIGFCILTWASLWWVRIRFKQNLANIPNA
jgi:F0F1-type ATP synthase membrane subunit c/vacuolar-type H+-ATPase subunit K